VPVKVAAVIRTRSRGLPGRRQIPDPVIVIGEWVYDIWAILKVGGFGRAGSSTIAEMTLETVRSGRAPELLQALQALPESDLAVHRQPLAELQLGPPCWTPSFRDFYAFEQHVRSARKKRGLEMIPEWYEQPVFYFSNPASIVGHGAEVRKPPDTAELDYELELGAIIGKQGRDIPVSEADAYIAGFTIINDWSARDLQRREMKVGLGPAKGKDFATSVGPFLVTPDELEDCVLPDRTRGKRYDLLMTAQVNGREYSRGNASAMHWTFAELIAQASRNAELQSGDLIGSGTVGTGCIVEFPEGTYPWLVPGDVVRLEIEGLGALENGVSE
jgi:fumarylacetoacetate (FAA) hydrolase